MRRPYPLPSLSLRSNRAAHLPLPRPATTTGRQCASALAAVALPLTVQEELEERRLRRSPPVEARWGSARGSSPRAGRSPAGRPPSAPVPARGGATGAGAAVHLHPLAAVSAVPILSLPRPVHHPPLTAPLPPLPGGRRRHQLRRSTASVWWRRWGARLQGRDLGRFGEGVAWRGGSMAVGVGSGVVVVAGVVVLDAAAAADVWRRRRRGTAYGSGGCGAARAGAVFLIFILKCLPCVDWHTAKDSPCALIEGARQIAICRADIYRAE